MRKWDALCVVFLSFLVAETPAVSNPAVPVPSQPNIVLIMADDVSPDIFGCYGGAAKTPHIDSMAKEGVMFKTAWASAMCSPTRATMMTGKYPNKTGIYHNALMIKPEGPKSRLFARHKTFSKLMQEAGYLTAVAGKWHVGYGEEPHLEVTGFDQYSIWQLNNSKIKHLCGPEFEHTGAWENETCASRYWHPSIVENGTYLDTKPTDYGPDIFTQFICDFMEEAVGQEKPFLAYYPMVGPHDTRTGYPTTPLRGDVGDLGDYKRDKDRDERFAALNEYIDVLVGRILSKVKALGIEDNTIIIFCSDNATGDRNKMAGVEWGCRVPVVASGAGIKKRGAVNTLMDFSDFYPTLCDWAGVDVAEELDIDGKSLVPFFSGKTEKHRDWIYSTIATTQLLRTEKHMLEVVNPYLGHPAGRFYYCGDNREGPGYEQVTNHPEHAAERKKFDQLLEQFPPITADHAFWQTPSGKKFEAYYTTPQRRERHLYNHPATRFYDQKFH